MPKTLCHRRLDSLLVAFVLTGTLGCVGPQRAVEKAVYCCEAKKAYNACAAGCSLDCESERHFERGWRRGYVAAALGRDLCPPALPPHPYLGKRYQSPEGQQLTSLWFAGYEEGALAAKRCGRGPRVVTHEVGCRDGCEDACSSPMPGVLPDAKHAVALQAASYLAPMVPADGPAIAAPEPEPAPSPGVEEAVPPPEPIQPPTIGSPEGPTARVEPPPESPPESQDTARPTESVEPSWEVYVAHQQATVSEPLAYVPSPTTRLEFPSEPGDLPPVKALPTRARSPSEEPEPSALASVPTPKLKFPKSAGDLPAVPVMSFKNANGSSGAR